MRPESAALSFAAVCLGAATAHAQAVDRKYVEEPTDGLALPASTIAGDFDARATVLNAAGLAFMPGPMLTAALDLEDSSYATGSGPGFGIYAGSDLFGDLLPKTGFGVGLEWLRPPRVDLTPDPGSPVRLTLAHANAIGRHLALGLAWHYYFGGGETESLSTFDLSMAIHANNYFGFGANVLDLDTRDVGGAPVQRRYQAEALVRPFGTDALEVSLGGRIGETRADLDVYGRAMVRAAPGFYVVGAVETRALHAIDELPVGPTDIDLRETRATIGLQVSFGELGLAAYGTGLRAADGGGNHVLGGTFIASYSASSPKSVLSNEDHIERVELSGEIEARALTKIVLRLRDIGRDPSAKAVVVVFDGATSGWAGLQEIRQELVALRGAHKKVFAYMVSGTTRDYFVASAADRIYVDPAGGMRLVGMAGETFYFRGAFDLVGIVPQFEKIGEYKSAPEELTESGPTPIAARMHEELFDSLWQQWLSAVSSSRHLSTEELTKLVDDGPYTAGELAQNTKLVDAVAAPDKVAQLIAAEMNGVYPVATNEITRDDRWERPIVAVIYVEGDITDGASRTIPLIGTKTAGGESIVKAIAAAREDPTIKAIVLRIDSPGGSALASELIAREVFATRGVKPIICSMSNLAASGGYFVAAGCDTIYAEPMTITGSIGIFFGKFDISGLVKRLGVVVDIFKRGKRADAESMFRAYTDEERVALLDKLRYSYGRFVGAVAEGRKLSKDAVDAVGRGHVYSGDQAMPLHLVDHFGGLGDALDDVRARIGVPAGSRLEIGEFPKIGGSILGYVGQLLSKDSPELPLSELPVLKDLVRGVPPSILLEPEQAQMRLPYDFQLDN